MSNTVTGRSRTIWIWVLIIVAVLIALSDLLDAARYMGWLPIAALGDLDFALPSASWLGALMSLLLAGIWFWVARKLYDLDPQGWLFVVSIAVINLIFLLMALLGNSTFSAILPGVVLNVIALVIGMLPSTKAAFGQA
ncbi:MAG: hypothetical protein KC410_15735 [Anaerolineales bacterium]|uniref:hypothetical protein n=1 Tax=Promineifilum sp. TaxID=2664178 RepID=UPI001DBA4A36|nr:hypothetical protein [Anaerolineales bacterium]MCB8934855.1 hypothetical protein [Promineifilum sp.]MCO5181187.1 hypothetical protein [Promineifilum sp.]